MGKTIVFDLDGTLADTSADLIAAANACFDTPRLDPVHDQSIAFRGGRAMLRLALERHGATDVEAHVERLFPEFLEVYAENIDNHTVLYPGARGALDSLAAESWRIGVCTNKPVELANELLNRLGILKCFGAVLGADSLPVRKPDPQHLLETIKRVGGEPALSVLVGDTQTDRDAARNARIPCILVGFGPEGTGVERLEPEAILMDYRSLPVLAQDLVDNSGRDGLQSKVDHG